MLRVNGNYLAKLARHQGTGFGDIGSYYPPTSVHALGGVDRSSGSGDSADTIAVFKLAYFIEHL